jgi:hypothetical protein
VATFCEELASQTSEKLQNSSNGAVLEPFLTYKKDFALSSWIPHPLGPLSQAELQAYLTKLNPETRLEIGESFHFYHADLGPTNILYLYIRFSDSFSSYEVENAGILQSIRISF